MNTTSLFLSVLQTYLLQSPLPADLSTQDWAGLYRLSRKHDVAHLLGTVCPLEKEQLPAFYNARYQAVFRYERQESARRQLYDAFEKAGIDHLPLKGSVIKAYYPEPWHRTGCDIDILVRSEDLDRAKTLLTEQLGCRFEKKTNHDLSIQMPGGVHLELHYDFEEQEVSAAAVWQHASPVGPDSCRYAMAPEWLVYCHIAHMAKHTASGGCGFRPFLDLWFLNRGMPYDRAAVSAMLGETGLDVFGETVFGLTEVWFAGKTANGLQQSLGDYILKAGVYGSTENMVAIRQTKQKSKRAYFLNRIFQPYEAMRYPYPILDRHRWLLPVCQVHRWCKLLFGGKAKRVFRELYTGARMNDAYKAEVTDLLQALALQKTTEET